MPRRARLRFSPRLIPRRGRRTPATRRAELASNPVVIMPEESAPTLRQIYDLWVEDQIEDYKDSVSRSDLLRLAEDACDELRVNPTGQYQITEILLTTAVDRKIFSLLKLPGFRAWSRARRNGDHPDPRATDTTGHPDLSDS